DGQRVGPRGKYDKIDVPILQQCGWYDAYPSATFRMWNGIVGAGKPNQHVLMGPWSHAPPEGSRMGELDFGPAADVQMLDVELRWFDHWLKGIDTGLTREPPIRIFVM